MGKKPDYHRKVQQMITQLPFNNLTAIEKVFIQEKAIQLILTFQELRKLVDIAIDLRTWNEKTIVEAWPDEQKYDFKERALKERILGDLEDVWNNLKNEPMDYSRFQPDKIEEFPIKFESVDENDKIIGNCPVASERTRCCNLLTLDVVRNCPYDCHYCCIQSFYHDNKVLVETNLAEKLDKLKFNSEEIYHIGTGQSSDSLALGNKDGILDALMTFAKKNPNVIFELKTKSNRVEYFINNPIPKNIIVSWTLNTPTIIKNEERRTVSLEARLKSARTLADLNILVGFHFHPMVYYKDWQREYSDIMNKVIQSFLPHEVVMVSFGTLTYTKPVIKSIRKRNFKSKVLQMPLVEASGKWSYPTEIKTQLFQMAYNQFKKWHSKVFFYLCMEDIELWKPVFGYEYNSNDEFEEAMKQHYIERINQVK